MAKAQTVRREEELLFASAFQSDDSLIGEAGKSRGQMIERKIEVLENLASRVSNRQSRRWLNDRLLIELVPRLNFEEIRGLFAPPPWGDDVPLSAFCMAKGDDWDSYRNIDMDVQENMMKNIEKSNGKRKVSGESDKVIALNGWHRVDRQTREALRKNFLSNLLEAYEERVRSFIEDSTSTLLSLHVQDPYNRLLLHGVCEFYDLKCVTVTTASNGEHLKTMTVKKKPGAGNVLPAITLVGFLKMAKAGAF